MENKSRTGYTFVVPEESEGTTLRNFLTRHCGLSRKRVREASLRGDILVDHEIRFLNQTVSAGQIVEFRYREHRESSVVPQPVPIQIVFEDTDFLVVEKPPGQVVHPTLGHADYTLANGIAYHWLQQGCKEHVRIVTRLDRNTSGLVLVARNELAQHLLTEAFAKGEGQKRYLALVHGYLQPQNGIITAPIGLAEDSIIKRCVTVAGKPASTIYRALRYWNRYTLADIVLETGRTHQIRVHFAHQGYPLVGDDLYGGKSLGNLHRQGLHAYQLKFRHPRTAEEMVFTSPLPADINSELKVLSGEVSDS